MTHPFTENGPGELHDPEAERNSMWCDACGGYHAGDCFEDEAEHEVCPHGIDYHEECEDCDEED